uniref:Calcium-binding and coiled-coil domain-containing protein 2 n=1 Tax=Loxodonta africana TaxID=9785 RepID=G3U5S4_LOXAF
MEEIIEDPPTSAVLLDHCHFAQVIFNSVEKFYVPGGDITCYYTLTQHFIPRRKDWIGIFRVGWKTTREYYTFMKVRKILDQRCWRRIKNHVVFSAYYLPKDDEYYQFCYVDQDGVVRGASIPFQFRPENEDDILVVTTQGEVEEIDQRNQELCKENQELKDSCVNLQKQNSDMQAELQKMQEELETLKSINKKLEQKVKEQEDSWEGDQDKTKQLEHLKKENDQLFLSLTDQRKHQKKLEQTMKEMKQKETTATKKQQELTDQNFDLTRRLSENEFICKTLQKEKEKTEGENDLLKRENSRLLSYMGLDFDSSPYQVPASAQGGAQQNPGLVYGNPYCGIQESSYPSVASIKKCPTCNVYFTDGMNQEEHTFEQHGQVLCLDCPVCDKSFPLDQKQIFEDHVLCHSL